MALAAVLLLVPKGDLHLYLNQFHSPLGNKLFYLITFFGDGLTPAILGVLLLLFSFRKGLILGLGAIFAGIIAQSLKRLVFSDIMRPKAYFEGVADLYFVPGVEVHSSYSFPSGHTTTVFCLFFILAYFVENKYLKLVCLMCALFAGYSRIYLSQHFLVDVYFGALFGVLSALLSIKLLENSRAGWLNKSLLTILKKNE